MNITVKKLSPDLIEDYIYFHKHVAFSDNPEWAGCYCVWYHWDHTLDIKRKEYEDNGGKEFKLELAKKYIKENKLRGYLAYNDKDVIGWCNANSRENYSKLNKEARPDLWADHNNELVKSIICFTIAPQMRRKGLTSVILNEIIKDTKEEGYDYIEAYPGTGNPDDRSYHGSTSIYEKNGFTPTNHDLGVCRLRLK